jgi:phosphoribosylamine-glycine ligase
MADGKESLRVLLVGNGGREHALAWKLSQSPSVEALFVAPGIPTLTHSLTLLGNGGTSSLQKTKNINIGVSDFPKLVQFAQENNVNLVVPGPEVPLVEGIETVFRKGTVYSGGCIYNSRHTLFRTHSESGENGRLQGILERLSSAT